MNIYIWDTVSDATTRYHDGGGIVVIAATLERARELLSGERVPAKCEAFTQEPDLTLPLAAIDGAATEEHVFVFPNAGCC